VSKQKIILFISLIVLLIIVIAFYFFIQSQKIEIVEEYIPPTAKEVFEEKVLNDLSVFETPTSETSIPYVASDSTIKNEIEVKEEIDSYVPEKNTPKKSNQEILDLLSDPNFKAY